MDETFLRLLISFERMLPLMNESGLHDVSLATKIYSMSEGCLGEISTLLTQAAVRAVKTGKERIDAKLLDSLNWVSPSNRKRQIDRISG
jgi:hypothetical protein